MIIYSVTYNLDPAIESEWLDWIQQIHVPRIMRSGSFVRYTLQQLIEPVVEGQQIFNLQFHAHTETDLDRFLAEDATILHGAHDERFGELVNAFDIVMVRRENK